uniref:Ig-like domain-containing protein n=1 Tax=Dendroctonus ponderosae TaxID=77166 RepID=A0AAR5P6H8_DENPD
MLVSTSLLLVFLVLQNICASLGLKALKLSIPRAVRAGHSVTLGCEYDLDEAQLYSVKWYREQEEFFRYVPKEEPPTRVFTTSGLQVDISVSNANSVTLLSVNRDISGQFQCEVSADAPLFHTQSMSALMTVVVVPAGVPLVTVDKTGLEQGRPLIADCHAPPSHPAANITFFVNDEKVPGYTSEWTTSGSDQLDQKSARLELTGVGGSWDPLRITCEASLFKLYHAKSVEVQVRPDTPQPASVLLMETSSNSAAEAHFPAQVFPIIGLVWTINSRALI